MDRVLRLLTIYILQECCITNPLAQSQEVTSNEFDDMDGNHKMNLMGFDYYNGVSNRDNNNEYYDESNPTLKLQRNSKETENNDYGNIVVLDTMDTRNYKAEIQAGNKADLLGINPHYYQPETYPDFGRRFVPQYPYTEIVKKTKKEDKKNSLIPKYASPELVLAVAKESARLDAAKPKRHDDEIIRKDILRTGDYWNAVWKSDVDPQILRTKHANKLESVRAKITPGSKLYDLMSKLKALSPTLLYVINEKES